MQLQKDELEFLLSGIRHVVLFGEAIIKEGSDTEIVTGHQQIVSRMTTLTNEREKAQLEPVVDCKIDFVEGGQTELGTVMDKGISAEQSTTETPIGTIHSINRAYSFKVILVDKQGSKV